MLDRLEDAFADREASQERLRRFIADASHELRTPLVSIRGYAELYRMGAATQPEDVAKAMRRIEDEAARMGVLVEDLLTLARLDEVRSAPHGPVDLTALARDAVDDARVTAPERDISLHATPARVTGDADQLRQVLGNLLRNALVHTPAGTPIDVSVEGANGSVELSIRDHGKGLPTDDPNALFERFWRAEGGRERGKSGAGLGLAIVAGIVDAHGGTVSAANAPGGGAEFAVRLPSRCRPTPARLPSYPRVARAPAGGQTLPIRLGAAQEPPRVLGGRLRLRADAAGVTRSDLTHAAATAALELLPDGVLVVCDGEVLLANRALCRLAGDDLVGRPAPDWLQAGDVEVEGRAAFVTVAPCEIAGGRSGSVVTVRDADAPSVLAHRASHDGLTGLLNQRAFRERLAAEVERGETLSLVVDRPRPLQVGQ